MLAGQVLGPFYFFYRFGSSASWLSTTGCGGDGTDEDWLTYSDHLIRAKSLVLGMYRASSEFQLRLSPKSLLGRRLDCFQPLGIKRYTFASIVYGRRSQVLLSFRIPDHKKRGEQP